MPLRRTLVLILAAIGIASAVATAVPAQETAPTMNVGQLDLETYRYAVSAERRSIMGANLELDVERRTRFFGIYDDYAKDRVPLDNERFSLVQRYAAAQAGLSDPQAMALVRAVAALQIKEIQLRSRYAERIDKEMGGRVGARFYQVDDVITTATRLNSLQGIPLAGARPAR
jgi:hypothetical protein